jgi:hypothetical protein
VLEIEWYLVEPDYSSEFLIVLVVLKHQLKEEEEAKIQSL